MKSQRELSIIGACGGYSKTSAKHAPVVGNSVLNLLINILGSGSVSISAKYNGEELGKFSGNTVYPEAKRVNLGTVKVFGDENTCRYGLNGTQLYRSLLSNRIFKENPGAWSFGTCFGEDNKKAYQSAFDAAIAAGKSGEEAAMVGTKATRWYKIMVERLGAVITKYPEGRDFLAVESQLNMPCSAPVGPPSKGGTGLSRRGCKPRAGGKMPKGFKGVGVATAVLGIYSFAQACEAGDVNGMAEVACDELNPVPFTSPWQWGRAYDDTLAMCGNDQQKAVGAFMTPYTMIAHTMAGLGGLVATGVECVFGWMDDAPAHEGIWSPWDLERQGGYAPTTQPQPGRLRGSTRCY
jgi:hypothetical protein